MNRFFAKLQKRIHIAIFSAQNLTAVANYHLFA